MNESDGPSAWKTAAVISAMTAVWITTAGHTMNFREMEAARGWIASE
jgi:predicted esterase